MIEAILLMPKACEKSAQTCRQRPIIERLAFEAVPDGVIYFRHASEDQGATETKQISKLRKTLI